MGVRVAGYKKPPSLKKVGGNKFQALIRIAILRLSSRRTILETSRSGVHDPVEVCVRLLFS